MLRPPAASKRLRAIAEALLSLATELEALERETPSQLSPRALMAEALADAAAMIATGATEGNALSRAGARRGIDYRSISGAWKLTQKKEAAQDLYARRVMARQLMDYGLDREQVAEIVGCHPNHIPRMIQALER